MPALETRSLQAGVQQLRALSYAGIARRWPLLQLDNLDRSWTTFAASVMGMVAHHRAISQAGARAYLEKVRRGVPGDPPGLPGPELEPALFLADLRATSVISVKEAMARGDNLQLASQSALVASMGTVSKYVADGGRELIRAELVADPQAAGFQRVTAGGCDWCEGFAGEVQAPDEPFPRHGHCGCQPEPIYRR